MHKIASLADPLMALVIVSLAGPVSGSELGKMRLYECARTSTPPKLDGRLDDACWRTAEVSTKFERTLRDADKPPSVQTFIQLAYDDEYLFVGIKCEEPHPERLKVTIREHDNVSVCGDDAIEMFFHPDPDSPNYYQLAANSIAMCYDGRAFDGSWNAKWDAAAHVAKDAWYLECAIALESFPERRSIWRFNVCRELRSTDPLELHCWSNTHGAFHTPSRFGHLIFSGALASLRRGALIQTAHYAQSTLRKQQQLERQTREIQRLRAAVPTAMIALFERELVALAASQDVLMQKHRGRQQLSLAEWGALDKVLGDLIGQYDEIYWQLKFHVLLND